MPSNPGLAPCYTDADGIVKLWDTRMVAEVATLSTEGVTANKCSFDRSGAILGVGCDDNTIKMFSTDSGELLTDLQVMTLPPFQPAARRTVAFCAVELQRTIRYLNANTQCYCASQGHEDAVQAVLFDNAGKFIISCGSDNTFRIWN